MGQAEIARHAMWQNMRPQREVRTASTRGYLVTRIKHKFSENGRAELKFLLPTIIVHLSSLKFCTVGLDRLCIG